MVSVCCCQVVLLLAQLIYIYKSCCKPLDLFDEILVLNGWRDHCLVEMLECSDISTSYYPSNLISVDACYLNSC